MPTLSKLVAALIFGVLGYVVSGYVDLALPSDVTRAPVYFAPANAAIGALIGWVICGAKSGAGYTTAAGVGLTSAVALTVVCLLVWAFLQMMKRALRLAYDGPVEALLKGVAIAIEFGSILIAQPVALVILAVGGVIGGLTAEPFAEHRSGT